MRNKFLIFLILLALILGGVGFWYYQKNIFSKEILKLEISGPSEAKLAEEVEYNVKYKNNGNVRLEDAKLYFEYPNHSITPENKLMIEKSLDDIYPGEERNISFKARLIGKEGEMEMVKATLRYRPKNLSAFYESETTFTTQIKDVPLTFEFDLPSKTESGKEIRLRLNYFSNVNYPLSDLGIKLNYPSDFEFLESTPQTLDKTEFDVGLLNLAEGGRIEVLGKMGGNVGEVKIFQADLGQWQNGEFVVLKTANKGVEIIKPLLYIIQEINGNPKYIANPGDLLHYEITFKNIGERILENMFLIVKLEGDFDFDTLKNDIGNFNKDENKIIFDYTMVPELKRLLPMAEGKIEFWIKLKDEFENKNPEIKNTISLDGFEEVFSNKVNSKIEISQKGYFSDEIFGNSGPLPPRVGETTTYTIMWQVKNWNNDLKNVKVKATLPPEVKLTGKIFPEDQASKFAFDPQSREIVWEIGDLAAGTNPGPNINFQIALTPTTDQRGKAATLISQAQVSAEDLWTESTLEKTSNPLDTTLPDDSTITESQKIVQ
jgi:hypothetical protein